MHKYLRKINTARRIIKKQGINSFIQILVSKLIGEYQMEFYYKKWIKNNELIISSNETLKFNPLISVIVPVYNVSDKILIECIESVIKQTYSNWELCLVDDCSTFKGVKEVLKRYESYKNIHIKYRTSNGNISVATNDAIEIASGDFIALLDCDDILAANALYEVVKVLNVDPTLDFIYSDEDKLTVNGKRHHPFFKPDWSPDTLMSLMYTCHLSVYRRSLVVQLGGYRSAFDGAQDYDFVLRFSEITKKIYHVPKILYHWRENDTSTASNIQHKPYVLDAMKKAKVEALKRRNLNGRVYYDEDNYQYRVVYNSVTSPLISIIILSKDNFEYLKRCVESLVRISEYKNYEIILVDNGSNFENKKLYENISEKYNIKYCYEKRDFNYSYMCNYGRKKAKGEYLLFLNDDTEIIQNDWLNILLGQAELEHVAAVGAKLLYPNSDLIQHAGIINLEIGPSHCLMRKTDKKNYYFGRNKYTYNYVAVTGACMLIKTSIFDKVEGFDENFPIAYNDVEFCFKCIEMGLYNVIRNDVVLYHHESISRGNDSLDKDKLKRLKSDRERLYDKHPDMKGKDMFYNINLCQDSGEYIVRDEKISYIQH